MNKDLTKLLLELDLGEGTLQKIESIRKSQPSRKVRSSGKNVSGFYPSKKMGVTIQFESRTLELAAIYEKEFDSNVVEYYDQPETFPIRYQNKGRSTGHYYTPDFFVIEREWIGYEEWKTEKELSNLILKYPGRYSIDEAGAFRCPPAEEYAKAYGLSFRIRTSSEIDWTFQRNIRFLEDYLIGDNIDVSSTRKDIIINLIAEKQGISLERLLNMKLDFGADDIYLLLAQNEIYADINDSLIIDFDKFSLFLNKESSNAFYNMESANVKDALKVSTLNIYPLQPLLWSAEPCTILSISESSISIMNGEREVKIPHALFEKLYQEGSIKPLNDSNNESTTTEEVIDIILSASPKSLEEANRKYSDFSININQIRPINKGLFNKTSFIRLSIEEKRNALYQYINSEEYPPLKLSDVTKQIGYKSNESLRAFFPDECRLISARYKAYKSKVKSEQLKKIKQQISECVSTAFEEGKVINKNYIYSKVKIGGKFAEPEIRDYIKEVLELSRKDFY